MLTSQLDSQRMYFEDQLIRLDQQTLAEVSGLRKSLKGQTVCMGTFFFFVT